MLLHKPTNEAQEKMMQSRDEVEPWPGLSVLEHRPTGQGQVQVDLQSGHIQEAPQVSGITN